MKRFFSILTALALCLNLCPAWAFAAEPDPALCKHHPAHTEDCGFIAPSEGQPCGHQHTAECYTQGVLPHPDGGNDYEISADTENPLDCRHSHDSECGYVPANPGQPCGFVCRLCPIEDLIAALPEEVTADNADGVRAQLDQILALFSELTGEEQEQIDLSRCYALQEALQEALDEAAAPAAADVASVTIDGQTTNYTNIHDAWRACSGPDLVVTLTLLQDVNLGADSLSMMGVKVGGHLTFRGGSHKLTSYNEYGTIRTSKDFTLESGTIENTHSDSCGVEVLEACNFMMTGGSVSGYRGIYIQDGWFTMTGGTVTGSQFGVLARSIGAAVIVGGEIRATNQKGTGVHGRDVSLSGGTISGGEEGVAVQNPSGPAGSLLVPGYLFFDPVTGQQLEAAGPATQPSVVIRPHSGHTYGPWQNNGDGTHVRRCSVCRLVESGEHSYSPEGTCTVCGADQSAIVARVEFADGSQKVYTKLDDAWKDAMNWDNSTITLLQSVTRNGGLYCEYDVATTFCMAPGVSLTMTSDTALVMSKGNMTLKDCTLTGTNGVLLGLEGTLSVEGGSITGTEGYGISVETRYESTLALRGARISGQNHGVTINSHTTKVKISASGCTFSGTDGAGIFTYASLTAENCTFQGNTGLMLMGWGSLTDCTVTASGTGAGISASAGAFLIIPNGSFTGSPALLMRGNSTARLSGGTFYGGISAESSTLASLLTEGVGYYRGSGAPIAGIGESTSTSVSPLFIQPIHDCSHIGDVRYESNGDAAEHLRICCDCGAEIGKAAHEKGPYVSGGGDTHSALCVQCGYVMETAPHNQGADGICQDCGQGANCTVTANGQVRGYMDFKDAWQATENAGPATITLLADMVTTAFLSAGPSQDITLASAEKPGGGDFTITCTTTNPTRMAVDGGKLHLSSGCIKSSGGRNQSVALAVSSGGSVEISGGSILSEDTGSQSSAITMRSSSGSVSISGGLVRSSEGIGIQMNGGSLSLSDGTVEGKYTGIDIYASNRGTLSISGGTVNSTANIGNALQRRDKSTVSLTGGQFKGGETSVKNESGPVSQMLAKGYAFQREGVDVSDASANTLTGTVTVVPLPLHFAEQPQNAYITYGQSAVLKVEVLGGEPQQTVRYQWYALGENGAAAIDGAAGASCILTGLAAGKHSIYCVVICGSTNLRSEPATVRVAQKPLTPAISDAESSVTKVYDATTDAPAGLRITLPGAEAGDDVAAQAGSAFYDNANAGTGKTLTATGITLSGSDAENYTLSATTAIAQGTIQKASSTITTVPQASALTYNGFDQTLVAGGTADLGEVVYSLSETGTYSAAIPTGVDAGDYEVWYKLEGDSNHSGTAPAKVDAAINPAPLTLTDATIKTRPYQYDYRGAEVSGLIFTGLVNGETLALNTDYTASGEFESADAGENKKVTITVTLTSAKASNYTFTGGSVSFTGIITKADSSITKVPTAAGITYGQALSDSALTGGEGSVAGAFTWTDGTIKPNAGTAQFSVTFTPNDTNYNTATADVSVTVAKATPTLTAPTASAIEYGQKLSDSALTGGTAANPNGSAAVAGSWGWVNEDTRPTATGTFPVAFVPIDTGNYNTPANVDTSVTVKPTEPKITLTATPAQQIAGGKVTVDCTVKNPHDAAFSDSLPDASLTYRIGSGAEQALTGDGFNIPAGTAVGTVITITAATTAVDGKYTPATRTAAVTVTDKTPVTISGVRAQDGTYNGGTHNGYTGTPSASPYSGGFTYNYAKADGTALSGPPTNAGDYTVTISLADTSTYIGSLSLDFTISKASITIKANDQQANVGNARPTLTYTASGLASGDTLAAEPTLTCDADMNKAGRYTITASGGAVPSGGNYNPVITYVPGTLTVTDPTVHVTSVTLNKTSMALAVGSSERLTATVSPSNATNMTVTWTSSNSAIARVDNGGNVTAVSAGSATITVTTADGGKTAACTVTVGKDASTLTLTPSTESLIGGGTVTLTLTGLPSGGAATVTCSGGITVTKGTGNTWTATLPNSTATYTFTASYAGDASHDPASASCTVETKAVIILPDPPAGDSDKQFKLVMESGISDVPAGLKNIESLNTPEKLETVLKTEITQATPGIPQANTAVYNVALLVSIDGGATWTPATADNFPTGGLTVTLPYPSGTDSSYYFTVVHMFTTSDFGKTPGDTEVFTPDKVTNMAQGLQVVVTGLSPISVGWTAPTTNPDTPPSGNHGGGGWSSSTYAITVEKSEHGKVTSNRTNASSNSTVTLTVTPDSGYVLDALTVTDSRGNEIKLTAQGGNKYTFTMPSRAVTVKASFVPLPDDTQKPCDGGADCPSHGFTDLGTVGTWYHEAVDYVLRNGLMNGYSNGTFGPNDNLSRAQFAQILFNKEGRPVVNYLLQYSDVANGAWYTEAIRWATSQGVVGGYGNGMFGPNDNITREQLAVMLWRYAGSPAATDKELHFTDADKASGYALEALRWAVENGILNGYGDGRLGPQGLATRAQVAQMLMNFLKDE